MTPDALLELYILSPVGIVELDADGAVLGANASARRLLAPVTRDGTLDTLMVDLGVSVPVLSQSLRSSTPPRGVLIEQVEVSPADGAQGLLLSLIRLDPQRHLLLATDGTSLASARAAMARATRQQTLVEQAVRDHAIYTLDREGRIDRWSSAAERVHQFSATAMVGRGTADLLAVTPAEAASTYARDTLELAARNGWCEEEGERRRADGTTFWASTVTSALHDAAGQVIGFSVVTQDRSDYRRPSDIGGAGEDEDGVELAGVMPRRAFYEAAGSEVARARRYGQSITLMLLDPDQVAEWQRQFGEPFVVQWRQVIASITRQESRASDLVGRVGGEGFGVILPSTELAGGLVLAERIRERMQRHAFGQEYRGARATLSIGVAEVSDGMTTVDDLFAAAGTAVDRARHAGMNLVVGYDP